MRQIILLLSRLTDLPSVHLRSSIQSVKKVHLQILSLFSEEKLQTATSFTSLLQAFRSSHQDTKI